MKDLRDADLRDALLQMVRAYRKIDDYRKSFVKVGLNENPLYETAGYIADAICYMVGEKIAVDEDFSNSTTHTALTAPFLANEYRVRILMAEYRKNHPEQPAPRFVSRKEILESVKKNGGYVSPEGDWK